LVVLVFRRGDVGVFGGRHGAQMLLGRGLGGRASSGCSTTCGICRRARKIFQREKRSLGTELEFGLAPPRAVRKANVAEQRMRCDASRGE
jgi:hypothetical protein